MEVIEAVRVAPMSADPLSYACIIKHYELEAAIPNDSLFENLSETLKEQLKLTMEKINLFTREKFNIVDSVESLVAWTTHLPERVDLEHELMSLLQRVPKERGWLRRKEARRVRDFVKLRTRELNELLAIHATITTPHYALARHSATITQLFGYSENELLARKIEVLQKLRSEYFLVPSPENFELYHEAAQSFQELVPSYEADECIRNAAEDAADELEVAILMDELL